MSFLLDQKYLIAQIIIGILAGAALALVAPDVAISTGLLGQLFVSALKATAPFLVFILIINALANRSANSSGQFSKIAVLYFIGTLTAAITAVLAAQLAKPELSLLTAETSLSPPQSVRAVLSNVLLKIVDNPITALTEANFIGLVAWGIALGLLLQKAGGTTKQAVADIAEAFTRLVTFVIRLAPIGIFGLVATTVATSGLGVLGQYAHLLGVLLGAMLVVALIINPLIVFALKRINPYPLIFTCLKDSGITAFFTRSSAANIPVNLALCEKLKLDRNLYSVSIPLGATVNMAGAAITVTVMTMAAVNTLYIQVSLATSVLLCLVASFAACGASGVAGGSLLLIPLACNLFGIPSELAMQVVAVGFVIGVVQDSAETALNSSTDVVFTAACSQNSDQS
jgi:serine/threonine transporter